MIQAIERITICWECPKCNHDNEETVKETSGPLEVLECCKCGHEDEFELVE